MSRTPHTERSLFLLLHTTNRYNFAAFYFPEIIAEWAAAEAAKQKQEAGQPGGGGGQQQRPAFAPPRKILYLDTDVVVQGSVAELWDDLDLRGYPAAAVEDCSQTFKFGYFRDQYNKYDGAATFASGQAWSSCKAIPPLLFRAAGINRRACVFNRGVLFIDIAAWAELKIPARIERWLSAHTSIKSFVRPALLRKGEKSHLRKFCRRLWQARFQLPGDPPSSVLVLGLS